MNTETLTNAQLFLTTKLTTRLTRASEAVFSKIDLYDVLIGIIEPITTLLSPSDNQDIYYLRELTTDSFDETDCPVKQVVSVINSLILLLMYGQKPENAVLVHEITGRISQHLIKTLPC
ncbi:MAG: hypothetical protein JWR05_3382 [Mucilaginibacter sp.]|nr:hypothetical protein [Mucilaginibacter sp.]